MGQSAPRRSNFKFRRGHRRIQRVPPGPLQGPLMYKQGQMGGGHVVHKEKRLFLFRKLLHQLNVADPGWLATQLMLLGEGAVAQVTPLWRPKDGTRRARTANGRVPECSFLLPTSDARERDVYFGVVFPGESSAPRLRPRLA